MQFLYAHNDPNLHETWLHYEVYRNGKAGLPCCSVKQGIRVFYVNMVFVCLVATGQLM